MTAASVHDLYLKDVRCEYHDCMILGDKGYRKRIEMIFSQLTDNLMMIRNYAKQSRSLSTHMAGKIAAMTLIHYVNLVNQCTHCYLKSNEMGSQTISDDINLT